MNTHIQHALDTFNESDFEAHMAAFADGATFRDPVLDEPVSGDEHREYIEDVVDAFPDITQEPRRVLPAEEATVIESTFEGTHEGELEGVPPTGREVSVPLVSVISVSDEGITDWRDYWDQQTFREQLGLTVPAVFGHVPSFVIWKLRSAL